MFKVYLFFAPIIIILCLLESSINTYKTSKENNTNTAIAVLGIFIIGIIIAFESYSIGSKPVEYAEIANATEIGYQSNNVINFSEIVCGQKKANFKIKFNNALNGVDVSILYGDFKNIPTTKDLIFYNKNLNNVTYVGGLTSESQNIYLNEASFSSNISSICGDLNNLDIAIFVENEIVYRDRISLVSN